MFLEQLMFSELCRFRSRVSLRTFGALPVFIKDDAKRIRDTMIDGEAEAQFGAVTPAIGKIAVQRWVRDGDFAPGYLNYLATREGYLVNDKFDFPSRGLLVNWDSL